MGGFKSLAAWFSCEKCGALSGVDHETGELAYSGCGHHPVGPDEPDYNDPEVGAE